MKSSRGHVQFTLEPLKGPTVWGKVGAKSCRALSEVREAAVRSEPGEEVPDRGGATGLGGLLAAEVRVVLDQIDLKVVAYSSLT